MAVLQASFYPIFQKCLFFNLKPNTILTIIIKIQFTTASSAIVFFVLFWILDKYIIAPSNDPCEDYISIM